MSGTNLPVRFGDYLLTRRLATGGMAEVFLATRFGISGFQKRLVIKRILPEYAENRGKIDMLVDEARICAHLHHVNVVQIFDLGFVDGHYFIAMEYVQGLDLRQILHALWKERRTMPARLACYIMSEALRGLDHAHHASGPDGQPLDIVHRDFTPANILVSHLGEIKVADFGIAKAAARRTHTQVGRIKGKLGYYSPEQVVEAALDKRSDIFTAGITFWETLACRRMFKGSELDIMIHIRDGDIPPLREAAPDLPEPLYAIVEKALHREPDERFQTAADFRNAIDDFLFNSNIKVGSVELQAFLNSLPPQRPEQTPTLDTGTEPGERSGPRQVSWLHHPGRHSELPNASGSTDASGSFAKPIIIPIAPDPERAPPPTASERQRMSFTRLFYQLVTTRKSGRLVVDKPGVQKQIYLRRGTPEFIHSNLASERLGDFLVLNRIITESQRDHAVQLMPNFYGHLGDTLIGLKVLKPSEMFEHLQSQVRYKLLEVFSWNSGRFRFYSGQTYAGEVTPIRLDTYPLITEGVRKYISLQALKRRYGRQQSAQIELRRDPKPVIDMLRFSTVEAQVVRWLAEPTQLGQILRKAATAKKDLLEQAYRVIYILDELDVIGVRDSTTHPAEE